MHFVSTRGQAPPVDFRTALFSGLAPDGGLFVPLEIPSPSPAFFSALREAPLVDVATRVGSCFLSDEISVADLSRLLADALNFPVPITPVDVRVSAVELFHGPTFAFKDVGARVMARLMSHFHAEEEALTILVATSGDTGSAVAQAFFGVEATRVVVLFPEGQVSRVQEAQFATLGGNVVAVAVNGTFDDCQRLAKEAFNDASLRLRARLTSANSINIGRLLPQMFYYVYTAVRFPGATLSVPSGNFGNLTAGLFAWKLGAPIGGFVAATTVNDTVPRYLATGIYEPKASVGTLANAMDVGDPSNVERMRWLFRDDVAAMRRIVATSVHTDDDVRKAIGELWREHHYLAEPHSAIGYLGTREARNDGPLVFLATAHAAKFREVVEPLVGHEIPLPPALASALERPRQVVRMGRTLRELRELL
ncbi:MAG TPA: threonine synthase [Vicinamibacterales bacterium]|nr:threonine synthase [Vicinamibacterales bacterium]